MNLDRIKDRVAQIAQNPAHVRFSEVETLLENHIRLAVTKYNHHGKGSHHAFTVGNERGVVTFTIPDRRPFLLKKYVLLFLNNMEELGLYVPEDDK
jgi:hypothetical protein